MKKKAFNQIWLKALLLYPEPESNLPVANSVRRCRQVYLSPTQ